jgi:chemotaxis protein methyltransferase CheR
MEMLVPPALEDVEIDLLLEGVYQYFGDDFRGYERAPLKSKVFDVMQACGVKTVSALQDRVMHDPAACELFLRALSVRPVALFNDADQVRALREVLGPTLRSCPDPKIWIAECTCAEDAFMMAILLAEEGLYDKTLIFATGANETLLQEAREGSFAIDRLPEYEENFRRSGGQRPLTDYCFESGKRMVFLPQLRRNIIWAQYSLATDNSFNEFQLIVCRRVLADFGSFLRRRTLRLFHESLSSFGLLSVDAADELDVAPFSMNYKAISRQQGLYRRVGAP